MYTFVQMLPLDPSKERDPVANLVGLLTWIIHPSHPVANLGCLLTWIANGWFLLMQKRQDSDWENALENENSTTVRAEVLEVD